MTRIQQNYSNYRHVVPGFHFVILGTLLLLLITSIYLLCTVTGNERTIAGMFMLMVLAIVGVGLYCRSFALRVQDRAIRAEENLRYYVLTGKRLSSEISMKQIIALRFAPDEEFIALTERTINEKLSAEDIKKAIKNWKADYHRA
jgi:hypothetical protein